MGAGQDHFVIFRGNAPDSLLPVTWVTFREHSSHVRGGTTSWNFDQLWAAGSTLTTDHRPHRTPFCSQGRARAAGPPCPAPHGRSPGSVGTWEEPGFLAAGRRGAGHSFQASQHVPSSRQAEASPCPGRRSPSGIHPGWCWAEGDRRNVDGGGFREESALVPALGSSWCLVGMPGLTSRP